MEEEDISLDYLPENEYFKSEQECRFYMETKLMQYISNYIANKAVGLEELMEIKQLVQRQKLERVMRVYKDNMKGPPNAITWI